MPYQNKYEMKKILSLFLLLTIPSFAQTKQDGHDEIARELSEKYRISVITEDTLSLSKMLHPKVVFSPPTGPTLNGFERVDRVIKSFLSKNDVTSWEVEILDIWKKGDMIFEFGEFEIRENATETVRRKYVNIWELHQNEHKLLYRGWSPIGG